MGHGRFDPQDWQGYTSNIAHKNTSQVFASANMPDDLNPSQIKLRESRNSDQNPRSTPILVMGDGTGSMGALAEGMLRRGCQVLTTEIYQRKPVTDPHLAFGLLGDVHAGDPGPLQVTQFEASIEIAKQLERMWLGGPAGGGNGSESHHLAWYFAAHKVEADAFKEGRKGFLFTYGDEGVPPPLTPDHIRSVFGVDEVAGETMSADQLLRMALRNWEVFHLIVEQGSGIRDYGRDRVIGSWKNLLGERAILLSDSTKMPEVIVSLMQVVAGMDNAAVAGSWAGDTSLVVSRAIGQLTKSEQDTSSGALVRF